MKTLFWYESVDSIILNDGSKDIGSFCSLRAAKEYACIVGIRISHR